MSSYLRYGFIENLDTVRRIPIGRFWGVGLLVTPLTWLSPFVFFGLHFLLNLLNLQLGLAERLQQSLAFALVVQLATAAHAFGHILSGKLAGGAMDELLITATRDVNIYHGDQGRVPGRVHLARALGGPLFNLLLAAACAPLAPLAAPGFGQALAASMVSTNLFFGLGGLLPLPSIDGAVIWRELLRLARPARR